MTKEGGGEIRAATPAVPGQTPTDGTSNTGGGDIRNTLEQLFLTLIVWRIYDNGNGSISMRYDRQKS